MIDGTSLILYRSCSLAFLSCLIFIWIMDNFYVHMALLMDPPFLKPFALGKA